MKRTNSVKLMLTALVAMLAMASVCWSAEPPPPVDQNLGIPDSVFNLLTEADCRACHNQNPPIAAVDPTYLPDRHHLLVGTVVPSPTAAPNPTVGGGTYECLTCHTMVWNSATSSYTFTDYRDCLLCHAQNGGYTVHHATAEAQSGDCQYCHSSLVDNMDDGHYIPTYDPSLATPYPSDKPDQDTSADTYGAGNCNFCHNVVKLPGTATTPVVDPASGVTVYTNDATHHTTGFGPPNSGPCTWCHAGAGVPAIRGCENCHGVKSLHSIQLGIGDTTSPGNEGPYKGHIGDQWDCWGCHGFQVQAASVAAPTSGVTPFIEYLSDSTVKEGTAATITVTGASFIDSIEDTVVESDFQLVDGLGNITTLETLSLTNDIAEVVVPSFLAAGSYTLTAVKGTLESNPKIINVTPAPEIDSVVHAANIYTVKGSKLIAGSGNVGAENGTEVIVTDGVTTHNCEIVAGSDSKLIAECEGEGPIVEVTNLYQNKAKARPSVPKVLPSRILSITR